MNLYLYDEKHEQILDIIPVTNAANRVTEEVIEDIIDFLDKHNVTNRYKRLVLANSFKQDVVDGESIITFE